jgi:hypothetical protein
VEPVEAALSCTLGAHPVISWATLPDKLERLLRHKIGEMPSPKTRTNLDTANHHVAEKSRQKSLHNFCGHQLRKRLSSVLLVLADATISSRETHSDLVLGRSEHTVNVERSKASNTLTARGEP